MRILLAHSDSRPFEVERFGAAWAAAGLDPADLVPVTPTSPEGGLEGVVEGAKGVLLTGGPDVEPWRFGESPAPGVELHPDGDRDALDLALLDRAAREGWPVLAVCYGIQILNVFHGGTLVQDLDLAGFPGHRVPEPKDAIAHAVALLPDVRQLGGLPASFGVNSRHHQAIDRLGYGLRAVAGSPDGLVEAVELHERGRFVVGVQWHPENLRQDEHLELFRRFRAAAG